MIGCKTDIQVFERLPCKSVRQAGRALRLLTWWRGRYLLMRGIHPLQLAASISGMPIIPADKTEPGQLVVVNMVGMLVRDGDDWVEPPTTDVYCPAARDENGIWWIYSRGPWRREITTPSNVWLLDHQTVADQLAAALTEQAHLLGHR